MAEKESDVSYYIRLIVRYKYLIIIMLMIFSSIGYVLYKYEVPMYKSTSTLVFGSETLAKAYNIYDVPVEQIQATAKSYGFINGLVRDLNLTRYPIKNTLIERALAKGEVFQQINERELTFYYMSKISVRFTRGIIEVSVYNQHPTLARVIADKVGDKIIEDSQIAKEQKIQSSIRYIDGQLASISRLVDLNRREKEFNEGSENFNEVMKLQEEIDSDMEVLSLFKREEAHLRTLVALLNATERANEETKLNYTTSRIQELTQHIEDNKERLRAVNKTEYYRSQDLDFALRIDEQIYSNLIAEKQKILIASVIDTNDIRWLSKAYEPIRPDKTNGFMFIIAFFGIGCVAAFGIIQFNELINKRFKSSDDVERKLRLKVIGNIENMNEKDKERILNPKEHPKSHIVESYRTISTNLKFLTKSRKMKSIVFSSDKASTGKSRTIANLATVMSESGTKILIIDADLRRPTIHKIFNINRKPGLTDFLSGKAKLNQVIQKVKDNLFVMPAGSLSYNPQSVLESDQMIQFIKACNEFYDFVFYDTIPLTSFSDVSILAENIGTSIIVMDEGKSRRDTLELAKERLEEMGANILGIIVNKARRRHMKYPYYYYYYHYSSEEPSNKKNILEKFYETWIKKE